MTSTNFPDGVTNVLEYYPLGGYVAPDPSKTIQFWDDFFRFDGAATGTAHDWLLTITQAGAGSATFAISDENGGVLLVTNDAADDDAVFAQWQGMNVANVAETFKFIAGKQTWFKTRFKVSDATQSDLIVGLVITDTTPLDASDGVYFLKADGSTTLNLLINKNSTATTVAVGTLANDTYVEVAFVYNGSDKVDVYLNNERVGTGVTTNLPDDEELAVTFGIQNGEAVAKTMSLDYIFAASER